MKSLKFYFKNRYINTGPYSYVIFVFLLIVLILMWNQRKYYDQIVAIRAYLNDIRERIDYFYNMNERYPKSLSELRQVVTEEHPYYLSLEELLIDLKSKPQKDVPEYRELNNKGGYYYDPNTGEIRLNLTRPVKEYLPFCYIKFRNQIPSEW